MSLQVPTYPSPFSTTPMANAYAWIDTLVIDFANGVGSIGLRINPDAASSGLPPIDRKILTLGQDGLPDLGTVVAANQAAFGTIREYLYQQLVGLPEFAGSAEVA